MLRVCIELENNWGKRWVEYIKQSLLTGIFFGILLNWVLFFPGCFDSTVARGAWYFTKTSRKNKIQFKSIPKNMPKSLIYCNFQASEFFLFACLMVLDMALLGFLAVRFTYVNIEELEQNEPNSESSGNNNVNNIPLEEKPSSSSRND